MGNNFSTQELKDQIRADLQIDLAFPFFPTGRNKGSAACCVVDAEWITKLSEDCDNHTIKIPTRSQYTLGGSQKQSPTVNIYVNMLAKQDKCGERNLQLFRPVYELSDTAPRNKITKRWPLITYVESLFERKGTDQNIDIIIDSFESFAPVSFEDNSNEFVEYIRQTLWPKSSRYKALSSKDDHDNLALEVVYPKHHLPDDLHDSSNSNLPEVFAVVESNTGYYFLATYRGATLQDLLTYNPGVLSSNLKKKFIIYQLFRVIASLHSRGILHGSLSASNILINDDLWIQLTGLEFESNQHDSDSKRLLDQERAPFIVKEIKPEPLVVQWVRGNISNFTYLMALNHCAGRREGDPNFHPVFPWVTDFTGSSVEDGWRDFKRTKFRMNKGDEQLDFTFDGPVPHHITDILSDITYYVYLARRTPIPVLCQFVRSKYEPNEYPSSMQRMYQWTPDECIPEFYSDATIFESLHPDMPNLQIPQWASSPEDFIKKHAEALESDFVSSNLHHWIDLTFGNSLTGKGAIEAKNVALPLLAGQNSFMKHGITQLFKDKHPQRGCNWKKTYQTCDESISRKASISSTPIIESPSSELHGYSTSAPSLKSTKSQRHSSISPQQPGICESPSSLSLTTGDKALSIHSTSSSIDTPTSFNNRIVSADTAATNNSSVTTTLRSEPIRLPSDMDDDYFTDNLSHFEDLLAFAAKYKFPFDENQLVTNSVLTKIDRSYDLYLPEPGSQKPSKFSVDTAYDMYCVGQIIDSVFSAGNTKVADLDVELLQAAASGYFDVGNGDVAYDIAPTGRINTPFAVTEVIEALRSENWVDRPTAKAILLASFSATPLRNPACSFPFPEYIPDMYEYLAAFYLADWPNRLCLSEKWIDRMCKLDDEAFLLILPTFTQLSTHNETQIGSVSLFPKLAQRLGLEKSRKHLLRPIISMFETLRPNIPKELFEYKTVNEFIKRFGIPLFLQQLLPCYLEALALNEPCYESTKEEVSTVSVISSPESSPPKSTTTVSSLASEVLVHICTLLGPVLTSKHIIRQLVKTTFRDTGVKRCLLQTIIRIVVNFGDTFTAIQYSYLATLIDTHQRSITTQSCENLCSVLAVLERLLPYMTSDAIVTELKSGLASTLYKLLELPLPSATADNSQEQNIKLQLTISMKTVEYLLLITTTIPKKDWIAAVSPMLQKYFSGFTTNTSLGDPLHEESLNTLQEQKNNQMIYAYAQLRLIVGKDIMCQVIPTSDTIETMMYTQFSSDKSQKLYKEASSLKNSNSTNVTSTENGSLQNIPTNSSVRNESQSTSDCSSPTSFNRCDLDKDFELDVEKLYMDAIRGLHSCKWKEEMFVNNEDLPSTTRSRTKSSASKVKVPTSVLPWRTKWKPSEEDKKNWYRFLSTNSEEMSKTMQFSFNDLKLRGFAGHTASIRTMTVNDPAKLFASGSRDRSVKLWSLNVHEGIENWETTPYSECLMSYAGHRRGVVSDVHFVTNGSSSGSGDLIASNDGSVHLWEPESGKTIHQYNIGRSSVVSLKPVIQSNRLIGGTSEGHITFFDTHNHCVLHTWKSSSNTKDAIKIIAVNQSETLIAVGFSTGAISLIESRTGTLVASWKGGDSEISLIKFYTDEILVTCAPVDHVICCWDVNRLALVKTISTPQDVTSLDVFKDEILTINGSNSVSFIPINDDFQAYSSKFKSSIIKSQVSSFAIIPADQLLLFGCAEGEIFLYA